MKDCETGLATKRLTSTTCELQFVCWSLNCLSGVCGGHFGRDIFYKGVVLKALIIAIAALSSVPVFSEEPEAFSIKNYTVGTAMESCPPETVRQIKRGVKLSCFLPATTYAGAEVKDMLLTLYDNEVISVMAFFARKGRNENIDVKNALTLKFGKAYQEKPHINQYYWQKGDLSLLFDGWGGVLMLTDSKKSEAAKLKDAEAKQSDM